MNSNYSFNAISVKSQIIEDYFKIKHKNGHFIGDKFDTIDKAQYFLNNCIDKKERKKCKILEYRTFEIERLE